MDIKEQLEIQAMYARQAAEQAGKPAPAVAADPEVETEATEQTEATEAPAPSEPPEPDAPAKPAKAKAAE